MQKNKAVKQYLSQYAEIESQEVLLPQKKYRYVITIPICFEDFDCLDSIFSLVAERNVLIIAVINSPIGKTDFQENNVLFIKKIEQISQTVSDLSHNIKLYLFAHQNDVLLVDRNSPNLQIAEKQGVGLARKIACDIALKLINDKVVELPWIFSTDADVILPSDYFKSVETIDRNYAAIVFDFQHIQADNQLAKAQYLYDFKMRYYLAGLEFIGSHYNYIPLGSVLVINSQCYAQVRGFPKRNAGEDFYILNKLAKIKPIKYKVKDIVINIQSRLSQRVPFGTGPALNQIMQLDNVFAYTYYHPQCFVLVKNWLKFLKSLWENGKLFNKKPQDRDLYSLYEFFSCDLVFEKCKKQINSLSQWQNFVHQWFDAFKTLKAIHFFDKNLPRLDYHRLLKSHDFVKVNNSDLTTYMHTYDKI